MFDIKAELKKLPREPGVYIMHDKDDKILYVGKAVNLKNRVSQYFQKSVKSPRIEKMISKIVRFEYIVTDNEVEALILECNLIKKHRPPYNVMLKDDKTYPYIKVTLKEQFPRVFITRSFINDGSKYYGPYTDITAVHKMLDFVKDLFPLKMCRTEFKEISKENRPCLNYHIKKCLAPCRGEVSVVEYREMIRKVCDFLDGKIDEIIKQLTDEMQEASKNLEFEKAGNLRDKLFALKKISEKQTMNNLNKDDMDVIGINKIGDTANIEVFTVRSGKLVGREKYTFYEVTDVEESELSDSFIKQFYSTRFYIPKSILIRDELADRENIERWLTQKRGATVTLVVPKRGEKNRLLEMAEKNAHESFKSEDEIVNPSGLLAKLLGISEIHKIEAYDISNIGNDDIVGGMVTFVNNKPAKNLYRKFKIKTVQMQDDISCTYEVVSRRLKNVNSNDEAFSVLPDLILADGGAGQVAAICRAIDEAGYAVPVVGMVKNSKHQTKSLLVNGKNIALSHYPEIFKFIYEIQEEVHRVAIGYHRVLRSKKLKMSKLDEIEGIGEVRKMALLRKFGDLEKIKSASVEEICEIAGITEEIALRLKSEL